MKIFLRDPGKKVHKQESLKKKKKSSISPSLLVKPSSLSIV